MKKLLTLIVGFLFLQGISAQEPAVQISIGGGASKKEIEKMEQMFQYQTEFYRQFAPIEDSLQAKIIVFESGRELQGYMKFRSKESALSNRIMGTFLSDRRELLVARSARDREIVPGAAWQISNYFVFLTLPNIHNNKVPSHWIQCGLNGFFKATTLKSNGVKHDAPEKDAMERIKMAINRGELDLKEFIGLEKSKIYELQKGNRYAYALAHSIVYFLMQEHKTTFLRIISQLEKGVESYDAITELYPGGFAAFEKDFFDFYKIR